MTEVPLAVNYLLFSKNSVVILRECCSCSDSDELAYPPPQFVGDGFGLNTLPLHFPRL